MLPGPTRLGRAGTGHAACLDVLLTATAAPVQARPFSLVFKAERSPNGLFFVEPGKGILTCSSFGRSDPCDGVGVAFVGIGNGASLWIGIERGIPARNGNFPELICLLWWPRDIKAMGCSGSKVPYIGKRASQYLGPTRNVQDVDQWSKSMPPKDI